jgi:phosphoglycerol transferase MdoB-like AlkP superfamily enzyme
MNNILLFLKKIIIEYENIFKFWIYFLIIGLIFRVLLLSIFSNNGINMEWINTIVYGLRMDTIVFSALWIFFIIFYIFNLNFILRLLLTFTFSLYLLIEIVTFGFFNKFFVRPNYLLIEHLNNYNEIFTMIYELYTTYIIVLIIFILFIMYKLYLFFRSTLKDGSILKKLLFLPIVIVLLAFGARSSLGSSSPNQGFYTFSKNNTNNEIANNSIFSILYASYLAKKEKIFDYGDLNEDEAISIIKNIYDINNTKNTLDRFQKSSFNKQKNIILVVLESFGHNHTGYLGGTPTTPNIDKLIKESLYFTNMYAVGTRTSWGISSVISSLYPLPTREYVKAQKSEHDFYTIAKTLKKFNYTSTFLYSGDANFDNMRGFLLSNGYDKVFGKEDFNNKLTKYTWGYCDEDLYDKALELIDIENKTKKPFFLTLLTLSSHEPFKYPQNKVEPYKKAKLNGFANSIKYSDYALGKFVQTLKDKGLMKNTIVAFIADHTENAYGNFDVPIGAYKIPALIVSDDYAKKGGVKYDKIASQIDFAPTILDVAGISSNIPTMGASVLKYERDSAILLARTNYFAYLLKNKIIILKPNKIHQTYNYKFEKISNNKSEIDEGLSYIKGASYLYSNKLYK